MKFKHFANLVLPIFFCGMLATAHTQTVKTNQPFSWMETSDSWYMPQAYVFKYASGELTTKGRISVDHGPACTYDCKESTSPDACTESLMNEKLGEVELPGIRIPAGYSGVEYVTFEVQNNGNIYGYQVVKQPVICPPCIQTAVNLVAGLGEWHPAADDGVFVKSRVVVPVYFK